MPAPVSVKLFGLSAGEYYSSGAFHGAWDIPCPTGTPVRATTSGVVIGCNRGVKPNRPGTNPGSGAPSNWVLIYTPGFKGYPDGITQYYQHLLDLAPGLKMGAKITAGAIIGRSDNTGNSSGPHLHWHVMRGRRGRYALYADHSLAVYPPIKAVNAWDKNQAAPKQAAPAPVKKPPVVGAWRLKEGDNNADVARVKAALGFKNNAPLWGSEFTVRVERWQKNHGIKPTGRLTRNQFRAITNM